MKQQWELRFIAVAIKPLPTSGVDRRGHTPRGGAVVINYYTSFPFEN
jgi:hypothetical protein